MLCIAGNGYNVLKYFWLFNGPLDHMLSAQRASDNGMNTGQLQFLSQKIERAHDITAGNRRKSMVVGLTCFGIDRKRTCRPVTSTQHVGANDKIPRRVEGAIGAEQTRPPVCEIRVTGKGMTYPNHITPVFIQ